MDSHYSPWIRIPRHCSHWPALIRIGWREQVEAFNRSNRWRKRGLRMVPVKYGIEDNGGAYKEGCSLGVLADGSVRLAHGGCELGQGIHTKAAQAAAFALGCPLGGVSVSDTSSLATPGSADTGGSATSECVVKARCWTPD